MMEADRFGPRAVAWSKADRVEIFAHILGLEMALFIAGGLVRNSAYARDMAESIANWDRLLANVPHKLYLEETEMYNRASRWAKAPELDRIRRMAELETIVESAISRLETLQITQPDPLVAERLDIWRSQLRETPERRA